MKVAGIIAAIACTMGLSAGAQTYGPYPQQTYRECGAPNGHTAVAIVHGGYDMWGSDNSPAVRRICDYFAAHGIYGVAFNYRLTPVAAWPAQWQDAQLMVRWLRSRGFTRVGMVGTSAGGYNALGVVFTGRTITWKPTDTLDEAGLYPRFSSTPDFAAAVSPISDMTDPALRQRPVEMLTRDVAGQGIDQATVRAMISPITKVTANIGPLLVIHGTRDDVVPFAQSESLVRQLRYIGAPVTFTKTTGGHVFDGLTYPETQAVLHEIGDFVTREGMKK